MEKQKLEKEKIRKYINKAVNQMKEIHPWMSKKNLHPNYSYAIEEEDGQKVFVSYFNNKEFRKTSLEDEETIIQGIISDQEWWVENQNPINEVLKLHHCGTEDLGGWRLEQYEFRKHELGGYKLPREIEAQEEVVSFICHRHFLKERIKNLFKSTMILYQGRFI